MKRQFARTLISFLLFVPCAQTSVVLISGVESGKIEEFDGSVNNAYVESTTKRTGNYSLRLNTNASAGIAISAADTIYTKFYVNIDTWGVGDHLIQRLSNTAASQTLADVDIYNKLGVYVAHMNGVLCGGTSAEGTFEFAEDTWYRIETKWVRQVAGDGIFELKVNGVVDFTITDCSDDYGVDEVALRWNQASNAYFDDMLARTDAYPGAGQIEALRPNAEGDSDTNYSGSYADIDNDPVDEGTSRTCTAATGDFFDGIADTSSLGESVGTLNAVLVGVWTEGAGASNDQYLRYKNDGGGTQESGNLLVDRDPEYHRFIPPTQPSDTGDLDGAQIGMRHDDSKDGYVYEMWTMVDYTPGAPPAGAAGRLLLLGVGP